MSQILVIAVFKTAEITRVLIDYPMCLFVVMLSQQEHLDYRDYRTICVNVNKYLVSDCFPLLSQITVFSSAVTA